MREVDEQTGAGAFGIVGALVGLVASVPLLGLGEAVPTPSAVLAVAAMALVSGAIHLDGLADTADALVAVDTDRAERARKDPAVGVAGAAALFLVLALDVASLTSLLSNGDPVMASVACVIAATVSRVVPVAIVRLAPSSTSGGGLGAWFARRVTLVELGLASATAAALVIAAAVAIDRPELLVAGLAGGLIGIGSSAGLIRIRRQLDGDLLGAGVELAVAGTLLAAAVLTAWPIL